MAEGADAEDRTEDPTAHKLDEAAKKGDVAKSQEVSTFFMLGALALSVPIVVSSGSVPGAVFDFRAYLMNAHLVPDSGGAMLAAGRRGLLSGLSLLAIPVGLVAVGALAAGLSQHRLLWTTDPLTPKFERISPMAGMKRIFGAPAMVQFVKGLLKIVAIGVVVTVILWNERNRLEDLVGIGAGPLVSLLSTLGVKLLGATLAAYALVTIGDVAYQRFSWMKRQRMSREEVKKEHKEQDGNPEIKAKLRQLRQQRAKQQVAAAVPQATVVLANPTHFAVALRYEAGMAAPVCVAKGVDFLAQHIKGLAAEHGVPVIENPPLARALHATVDVDDEIPVEHYKAVAEVIGFVLRSKRRAS